MPNWNACSSHAPRPVRPRTARPRFGRRLTVVALLAALVAAGCSSGSVNEIETTSTTESPAPDSTTSTTVDDQAEPVDDTDRNPLTGLPATEVLTRPALAVKIDNHRDARPQVGLDQADLVFEMRAEGVTRFMAVFHSQMPNPVGPVRSSRTSDFDLVRGLNRPLYASSGGNDYVAGRLRGLPIQEVTAISRSGVYFRDTTRSAPHNLFADSADLFDLADDESTPPEPWFHYRAGTETPSNGVAATGPVTISYRGSPVVTHTWDADREGWLRTQDNRPHTAVTGEQLAPENVVILITDYAVSPADPSSPELVSVGAGRAIVLTAGRIIEGTWSRPTVDDKPLVLDSSGNEILLTPGRTWVLFPEAGQVEF